MASWNPSEAMLAMTDERGRPIYSNVGTQWHTSDRSLQDSIYAHAGAPYAKIPPGPEHQHIRFSPPFAPPLSVKELPVNDGNHRRWFHRGATDCFERNVTLQLNPTNTQYVSFKQIQGAKITLYTESGSADVLQCQDRNCSVIVDPLTGKFWDLLQNRWSDGIELYLNVEEKERYRVWICWTCQNSGKKERWVDGYGQCKAMLPDAEKCHHCGKPRETIGNLAIR